MTQPQQQREYRRVLFSFGTFATGYLARPLGGVIFGHYGDRLGRKKMLVITMLVMGVASFLIGLVPGSANDRRLGRGHPGAAAGGAGHRRGR